MLTMKKNSNMAGHHTVSELRTAMDAPVTTAVSMHKCDKNFESFESSFMPYFFGASVICCDISHLPVKMAPTSMNSCLV